MASFQKEQKVKCIQDFFLNYRLYMNNKYRPYLFNCGPKMYIQFCTVQKNHVIVFKGKLRQMFEKIV